MRRAAIIAATVILAVVASLLAALSWPPDAARAQPPTGGTVVVDETFAGASVPDPAWVPSGSTCLTGAAGAPPAGSAPIQTCGAFASGPVPPAGVTPGYLQFTDTKTFQAGSILYNRPIPATAGISVVFEQYQYGGNQADGIGFFLVDGASTSTQVGADGGSLGYAQRRTAPGVLGGYVGIGLDVYGNFYDDGEDRGRNCPTGQRSPAGNAEGRIGPNIVTVRGPGNGLDGYCWLNSTSNNASRPTSTLPGALRGVPGPGNDLTPVRRLVNVQITPAPDPRVIVEIDFTGTGTAWVPVLDTPAPAGVPSTYKLGFLGSTGGNNDVHLIRNVVVTTINTLNDLDLVKQVRRTGTPLPPVITPGVQIPYDYVVTNAGLETLTGLTVTDDRVSGIVCPATTLPPQPDPAATVVCTGTYTVTAEDAAAGVIVNTAQATGTSPGGPVLSNPASVTVPLVSSLAISKTVNTPGPYSLGQTITYGYTVTNTGGSRISSLAVADNRVGAGRVICVANALDPGASTTCTGQYTIALAHVGPGGLVTNTATSAGVTPIGQLVTSGPASQTIPVIADIAITKSASTTTPVVGQTVTFTIGAQNLGPSAAASMVVTDLVPPGVTFISATPAAGTYVVATGAWTIPGPLAVNASTTLTLVVEVDTAAAVTNGASLTSSQVGDSNPANNSASVALNPVAPTTDIAVTKMASQPQLRVGEQVVLSVAVNNLGPFPATGVVVQDVLPSLLGLVSATPSQGTWDPVTGRWTVGDLAVGSGAVIDITVTGLGVGTVANTAALVAVSPDDINDVNNIDHATVEILPSVADLVTTKTVFPTTANVGDLVTYTITAANVGPGPATAVVVREFGAQPPGLAIESFVASVGTFDPVSLVWSIGALMPGGPEAVLTLQVRVLTAGTKTNSATIEDPTITDPVLENNFSSATLVAAVAPLDIAVGKSASAPVVLRGQTVTFTVTATNLGPTAATGLLLRDGLPTGFDFVSSNDPVGYDPVTEIWTIGALAVGASVELQITATAVAVGDWVNGATLESVDQLDTNSANDAAAAPVTVAELADLAILKSVDPTSAQPGDVVTYTVTITNNGPNDATDIEAIDPERLTAEILDVTVSQGTYDPVTRGWAVGSLSVGSTATLTALVRVTRVAQTVNTVQITQSAVTDPNPVNNTARALLTVPGADLAVSKVTDSPQLAVGQETTFTVVATNLGPDPAEAVEVLDLVPAGLTVLGWAATVGTYDPVTGVWQLGDLLPGVEHRLTIRVRADVPGQYTNTATISAAGPFDPDPANNSASAALTVPAPPPRARTRPSSSSRAAAAHRAQPWLRLIVVAGLVLLAGGAALAIALRWDRLRLAQM